MTGESDAEYLANVLAMNPAQAANDMLIARRSHFDLTPQWQPSVAASEQSREEATGLVNLMRDQLTASTTQFDSLYDQLDRARFPGLGRAADRLRVLNSATESLRAAAAKPGGDSDVVAEIVHLLALPERDAVSAKADFFKTTATKPRFRSTTKIICDDCPEVCALDVAWFERLLAGKRISKAESGKGFSIGCLLLVACFTVPPVGITLLVLYLPICALIKIVRLVNAERRR